jgi:hypothetical protein
MPVAVTNSLPTNGALAPDDLEAAVARLERSARTAWADQFRGWRWSAFVRLSWSWEVDEVRAADDLRSWAARLRSQVPGIVIMVGQHPDGLTHRRHAHALAYVPRRLTHPGYPAGVHVVGECWTFWFQWLGWPRGSLWATPFLPFRQRGAGDPRRRGAAHYVGKDPGTLELFGRPVAYRPRRDR